MSSILVTVYDIKADFYSPPMTFRNKGEAIRALTTEANNPDSFIGKHPNDFIFFITGSFNPENGQILGSDFEQIGVASEFVITNKA